MNIRHRGYIDILLRFLKNEAATTYYIDILRCFLRTKQQHIILSDNCVEESDIKFWQLVWPIQLYINFKQSLLIHEENTKKNRYALCTCG